MVTGWIDYRVRTDLTSGDRRFLGNRVSGSPGRIYCSRWNWIAPSSASFLLSSRFQSAVTRAPQIFTNSVIRLETSWLRRLFEYYSHRNCSPSLPLCDCKDHDIVRFEFRFRWFHLRCHEFRRSTKQQKRRSKRRRRKRKVDNLNKI